jgi:hypothetical protein
VGVIGSRNPSIKVNELQTAVAKLSKVAVLDGGFGQRRAPFTNLQPCIGLREIDIASVL